ncbi:MAG: hypothetical protein KDB27_00920 [Planctomycetales bacterium]|nr:hypothetical protein [Planctomycetales bacterium]
MKSKLLKAYIVFGLLVCFSFGIAAASGIRFPKFRLGGSTHYGRSYGGSWGGGK